jgi:hypothetical protein
VERPYSRIGRHCLAIVLDVYVFPVGRTTGDDPRAQLHTFPRERAE